MDRRTKQRPGLDAGLLHLETPQMPQSLSNSVWIDDAPDLDEHIVGIRLPRGSGQAEHETQVWQLHSVLLDRTRPSWKFHVFSGLKNGIAGDLPTELWPRFMSGIASAAGRA